MKHSKSQSLDSRQTSCNISASRINSSVYSYLRDRKLRNNSRDKQKMVDIQTKAQSTAPSILYEAVAKKCTTAEDKFDMTLNLLQAKINVMDEHTIKLQSKLKYMSTTFSNFCSEYVESPTGKHTVHMLDKLRHQFKSIAVDRVTILQKELKKQTDQAKLEFWQLMDAVQKKVQEQLNMLKVKMGIDRTNAEARLQSTIDALSYNNLIMTKLNKGDCDKIKTELSKYQQLRKKHQEIIMENERIKTSSMLNKFHKSIQLPTHKKNYSEEEDTISDQTVEEEI